MSFQVLNNRGKVKKRVWVGHLLRPSANPVDTICAEMGLSLLFKGRAEEGGYRYLSNSISSILNFLAMDERMRQGGGISQFDGGFLIQVSKITIANRFCVIFGAV